MDKSMSVLLTLKDHLQLTYPTLTSWTIANDGNDVQNPIIKTSKGLQTSKELQTSLVVTLKLKDDSNQKRKSIIKEDESLKDKTTDTFCPPRVGPTFLVVFSPVAVVSQELSIRCLLSVSLVTYHGHVLKKDFMTMTMHFLQSEQIGEDLASQELIETSSSTCELLNKLSEFSDDGFSLCDGLVHTSHKSLQLQSVFAEPAPEGSVVVRSRSCQFMLELSEMFPQDETDSSTSTCFKCRQLDASLISNTDPNETLEFEETGNLMSTSTEEDATTSELIVPSYRVIDLPPDQRVQSHRRVKPDQPDIGLTCQTFKQQFQDERDFADHKEGIYCKSVMEDFSCSNCGDEFKHKYELMQHVELCEDGPAKFGCSNCQMEFIYEVNFLKHQEKCCSKTKKKSNVNAKGKKSIKSVGRLNVVKSDRLNAVKNVGRGGSREIDVVCPICLRRFYHQASYQKHIELHGERIPALDEKTNCPVWGCDMTFDSRLDLNSHFLTDHGSEQDLSDKILCAQCLIPIERGKIREHLRLEHPHQRYVCTECGRECLFPSQLKQHWKDVHDPSNTKDYICELCGNVYARSTGLKQHIMSQHSEQRDFKCDHCEKGFTNAQRLRQHVRIHTGAKPYKCKLCEYRSNRSDNVLFHQRKVHKIARPTVQNDVLVFDEEL